jgi:hypothetical protein
MAQRTIRINGLVSGYPCTQCSLVYQASAVLRPNNADVLIVEENEDGKIIEIVNALCDRHNTQE